MNRIVYVALIGGSVIVALGLASMGAEVSQSSISVTDGDTFRIGRERVRILNIDTPEMGSLAECDAERMLALVAKDRLTEVLSSGSIEIERDGKDQFGRTLATIRVDGVGVGETLIAAHVAVRWAGRRHDWC